MRHPAKGLQLGESGFTFVELLIAMAIGGIIASAATATLYQILANNARNTAHMMAVKQVENALLFLSRDIQMAQTIQTDGLPSGVKLSLAWIEWDNSTNQVTYSLDGSTLTRTYQTKDERTVASYIASLDVTPSPYTGGDVSVTITSTVTGWWPASETRVLQVVPRS